MNYRRLGQSELQISEIGFGCMSLTGDDNDNAAVLHRAVDLGINFFDTADLYNKGMNEVSVGTALRTKRNRIVLATKVGNQWRADGTGWHWNPRKEYILSAIEDSLRRLQTDRIDLYQLHGGTIDDPMDETIEALEILLGQGKIRYYGISSIRPNVIKAYIQRSNMVSVMMQYSLLDRRPEEACLDLLRQNHIGVLARGSVAQGLLIGKEPREYLGHTQEDVRNAQQAIRTVSTNTRTPAQTAVGYVLAHPAITSAVVGMRTMQQLEDAIKIAHTPAISQEELFTLQNSIRKNVYDQHR